MNCELDKSASDRWKPHDRPKKVGATTTGGNTGASGRANKKGRGDHDLDKYRNIETR